MTGGRGRRNMLAVIMFVIVLFGIVVPSAAFAETTAVTIGVGPTTTQIIGSASPGALVTFSVDGTAAGSTIADQIGDYSQILTDQTPGLHSYEVSAKDVAGRFADTVRVDVSVMEHAQTHLEVFTPPTLHMSDNEVTKGQSIALEGSTVPNAHVVLHIDDSYVITPTGGDGLWQYTISTDSIRSGEHQLYAEAAKDTGQQSHATQIRTFIINAPPQPTDEIGVSPLPPIQDAPQAPYIGGPASGTTVNVNEVELFGTAESGTQIEVWNRDRLVGSVFADADGQWHIKVSLAESLNELKVRACRKDVCSSFSTSVQVYFAKPSGLGEPLLVSLHRYRLRLEAGTPATMKVAVSGGTGPYQLNIDWGDGSKESLNTKLSSVSFDHVYRRAGSFNGVVTVADKGGQSSEASFSSLVQAPPSRISPWVWTAVGVIIAVPLAVSVVYYQLLSKLALWLGWHGKG